MPVGLGWGEAWHCSRAATAGAPPPYPRRQPERLRGGFRWPERTERGFQVGGAVCHGLFTVGGRDGGAASPWPMRVAAPWTTGVRRRAGLAPPGRASRPSRGLGACPRGTSCPDYARGGGGGAQQPIKMSSSYTARQLQLLLSPHCDRSLVPLSPCPPAAVATTTIPYAARPRLVLVLPPPPLQPSSPPPPLSGRLMSGSGASAPGPEGPVVAARVLVSESPP